MSNEVFEKNLTDRLAEIEAQSGDTISLTEVGNVVQGLVTSLKGDISAADIQYMGEVASLAAFIREAEVEIAKVGPRNIRDELVPEALQELDAVITHTEKSAQGIMDAVGEMEDTLDTLEGDFVEKFSNLITNIYENSTFQDITSQRITKVMSQLERIENKMNILIDLVGEDLDEIPDELIAEEKTEHDEWEEANLLNGPQLEEKANSQEDIDAILASFD